MLKITQNSISTRKPKTSPKKFRTHDPHPPTVQFKVLQIDYEKCLTNNSAEVGPIINITCFLSQLKQETITGMSSSKILRYWAFGQQGLGGWLE